MPAETRMKLVGILSLLLLLCNVPSRLGNRMNSKRKYFLLTKFELPIVSYRPCFSSTIYGLSMKIAGHELKGKSRIIIYSMDREDEFRKIYYYTVMYLIHVSIQTTVCLTCLGLISIRMEQLQISDTHGKQNK